jgi:hypothetical protein
MIDLPLELLKMEGAPTGPIARMLAIALGSPTPRREKTNDHFLSLSDTFGDGGGGGGGGGEA